MSDEHSEDYSNNDVAGIWLRWKVMHYFAHNLTTFYPNIKAVSIMQSGLKEIQQSDMKTIPILEHLTLSANKIKKLDDGLFDYNPVLKYINLAYNQIYSIETNVFENMKSLQNLNLEGNTCIETSGKYDDVYDQLTPPLEESKAIAISANCSKPVELTSNSNDIAEMNKRLDDIINSFS